VQVTLARPFLSVIPNGLESVHEAPEEDVLKSTRTPGAVRPRLSNTVARIVDPIAVA
jgi:hypothetical protein